MASLLALPAGRRGKLLVLLAWIVVLGLLGPLIGRFEDAQKDTTASSLPASAESLAVFEASDAFPSGQLTPAVVVARRESGLTAADLALLAERRAAYDAALPEGSGPLGEPVPSADGTTVLLAAPLSVEGDSEALTAAVDRLREVLQTGDADGLEIAVTGPAGFAADAIEVFAGINGTLLLATASLVLVLLLLIYRSPIFWVVPLVSVFVAEGVVRGLGYLLATNGVTVTGQTAGILLVLVFGAGTDYALLLVARYREELRRQEDRHDAMRVALRSAGPAILASGGTVIAALLCLSLADVNSTSGLGPVGAMGVAVAVVVMLTVMPALLLVCGRGIFWPFVPRFASEAPAPGGFWRGVGTRVARRPRPVWVGTCVALLAASAGLATLDSNLTFATAFRTESEAVRGGDLLARSFPAGANAPTTVLVRDPARVAEARAALAGAAGVATVGERVEEGEPGARFDVTLSDEPYSKAAFATIPVLRERLATAGLEDVALVGGATAQEADVRDATRRDTRLLVPLVLAVVLLILVLLLRALVAPLLLMATVVLSFAAALGLGLLGFDLLTDFPGEDTSLPLYAFIFLVALGVDYTIFLMARVREEAAVHGTREGMLRGLAVTGSVITSAGIVLAGTFLVLAVLPLTFLTQLGIVVALGVLLDAVIVRSILVPALVEDVGARVWWPSALERAERAGRPPSAPG